jgi:Co/Zn/Cd efflux system component
MVMSDTVIAVAAAGIVVNGASALLFLAGRRAISTSGERSSTSRPMPAFRLELSWQAS